jgi:hypothetical protein
MDPMGQFGRVDQQRSVEELVKQETRLPPDDGPRRGGCGCLVTLLLPLAVTLVASARRGSRAAQT